MVRPLCALASWYFLYVIPRIISGLPTDLREKKRGLVTLVLVGKKAFDDTVLVTEILVPWLVGFSNGRKTHNDVGLANVLMQGAISDIQGNGDV